MRYTVMQNESHLMIAAHIEDDTVVIDTSTSITRQDNIGLFLSFLPVTKSALAPVDNIHLRMTVEKGGFASKISGANNLPADWQYICKASEGGYVFELSIPLDFLDEQQGGNWESLRLNWTLDDLDAPSSDWQKIERNSYYPAWGSVNEILGSGIFFKE